MKKAILSKIAQVYDRGENIINYLRDEGHNSIEDILISYDFQAGSYTEKYNNDPFFTKELCRCFLEYLSDLSNIGSIFEAGVGEANKLVTLINLIRENDTINAPEIKWGVRPLLV